MQLNLEGVAKAFYVGFLLVMWAVLDRLGINDPVLIKAIQAVGLSILGWHGINNWPGYKNAGNAAIAQLAAILQPPVSTTVTISPQAAGSAPVAPVVPAATSQ
jgi:hypothetical protein